MKKNSNFNCSREARSRFARQLSTRRGFTLIELLIVIAIIGILTTVLMANFIGARQRARDAQRKSDLRQIQSALEMYRADVGSYPSLPSCGSTFSFNNVTYMRTVPCDPINSTPPTSYNYYLPASPPGTYCLRACLENTNDSQATGSVAGCTFAACPSGTKDYILQNP